MTAPDGIALALAAVVPIGSMLANDWGGGWCHDIDGPPRHDLNIRLTHVGGRHVAEIVADVDTLRAEAETLRGVAVELAARGLTDAATWLDQIADDLDDIAKRLMRPPLVDAWHAQHPEVTQ